MGKNIKVSVPAYRLDVINDQDVVEDIAIAYGYDYIQRVPLPTTSVGSPGGQEQGDEGDERGDGRPRIQRGDELIPH